MATATDQLDRTFAALADPTRRAILARLAAGEASVTELAKPFEMSMAAVSKHLKVLERAGLIGRGRERQWRAPPLEGGAAGGGAPGVGGGGGGGRRAGQAVGDEQVGGVEAPEGGREGGTGGAGPGAAVAGRPGGGGGGEGGRGVGRAVPAFLGGELRPAGR